jgi:hypothetical protein
VGVLFFALRESIKTALKREVDTYATLLKFDLQREALKAELNTKTVHIVYPRLMEKLRRAEVALRSAVELTETDSSGFDEKDYSRLLEELQVPGGERKRLLDLFNENPEVGKAAISAAECNYLSRRAASLAKNAQDFAVSRALYLSKAVRTRALSAAQKMAGASFFSPRDENNFSKDGYEAASALLKLIEGNLEELEEQMISELEARSSGATTNR